MELLEGRDDLLLRLSEQIAATSAQLDIYSQSLPRELFGDETIVDALRAWVTTQPRARVRVFVKNAQASMFRGNALIELGLRLTTYFDFKEPAQNQLCELRELVVSDRRRALSWSENLSEIKSISDAPAEVALLQKDFDECWIQGQPSQQIRNLYL